MSVGLPSIRRKRQCAPSGAEFRITGQMSEAARSHRSAAQGASHSPYRAVLASDATPRCASMASADRQMIGDATLATPPPTGDHPQARSALTAPHDAGSESRPAPAGSDADGPDGPA